MRQSNIKNQCKTPHSPRNRSHHSHLSGSHYTSHLLSVFTLGSLVLNTIRSCLTRQKPATRAMRPCLALLTAVVVCAACGVAVAATAAPQHHRTTPVSLRHRALLGYDAWATAKPCKEPVATAKSSKADSMGAQTIAFLTARSGAHVGSNSLCLLLPSRSVVGLRGRCQLRLQG